MEVNSGYTLKTSRVSSKGITSAVTEVVNAVVLRNGDEQRTITGDNS